VKRTLDEVVGGQKVSERDKTRAPHLESLPDADGKVTVPVLARSGKRLKLALYALKNHPDDYQTAFWDDPQSNAESVNPTRYVMRDVKVSFHRWVTEKWCEENGIQVPPYPTEKVFCDEEMMVRFHYRGSRAKRRIEKNTKKDYAGDFRNEHLGGQVAVHAAPEVREELEKRGDLQVRRDENGHECTYLVSKSRRHQAEQLKEYNRRQAEAEARGWRGTHSRHGWGVKYLRHGGLTPD
jgi:hypothetical protein